MMPVSTLNDFASARRPRRIRSRLAVLSAATLLAGLAAVAGPIAAGAKTTNNDPNAIVEWNSIATSTLAAVKAPAEAFLYSGFVQAAVYDAVIGVHPGYQPYSFTARPVRPASAQAAAVAAAHEILVTYVPTAQAALDASYAASLSAMRDGASKSNGANYGIRVADHLIAVRANDGRNGPALFTQPPAPGVWRPTPPAFAPMLVPWLGSVTPLVIGSPTQYDPGPPPALTSADYTTDFNEVKALGGSSGSARTADQTATAMFFSGNAFVQLNAALRAQVGLRHLNIVDTARLFAAVDMSMTDAQISVWYTKLKYGFWRPITAINLADTDGNDDTTADPSWTPLLVTPPYPEYVSGYSGVTGAFARGLADALGTDQLDVTLTSTAVPGVTRHYDSVAALCADVISARVWLGIHFRTADTRAVAIGQHVSDYVLTHEFAATGD
jgi:hypothetical protein